MTKQLPLSWERLLTGPTTVKLACCLDPPMFSVSIHLIKTHWKKLNCLDDNSMNSEEEDLVHFCKFQRLLQGFAMKPSDHFTCGSRFNKKKYNRKQLVWWRHTWFDLMKDVAGNRWVVNNDVFDDVIRVDSYDVDGVNGCLVKEPMVLALMKQKLLVGGEFLSTQVTVTGGVVEKFGVTLEPGFWTGGAWVQRLWSSTLGLNVPSRCGHLFFHTILFIKFAIFQGPF